MPRPSVLAFNVPGDRLAKLRMVCMRSGLLLREVPAEAFGQPIGVLCGVAEAGEMPATAPDFGGEMLLFAHMSNAQVQKFLQTSRQMKAPSFPIKAVLTPTNAAWTAGQLYQELTEERAAIESANGPKHPG